MKLLHNGHIFESLDAEPLDDSTTNDDSMNESLIELGKRKIGGFSKVSSPSTSIGRKAEFYYVELAGSGSHPHSYIKPDLQNPVELDYLEYCRDLNFAKQLKDAYIKNNKLADNVKVNVIKRTKEVVG